MSLARLVHRSRPFEPTARVGVALGTARTGIRPIARASRSQASLHPSIHSCMHAFIHSSIHSFIHSFGSFMHACMHAFFHACIHRSRPLPSHHPTSHERSCERFRVHDERFRALDDDDDDDDDDR